MAVENVVNKISVNMKLNNGTKDGKTVTVSQTLPTMSLAAYDDEKAMAVIDAIAPCLEKSLNGVEKVVVSKLVESA